VGVYEIRSNVPVNNKENKNVEIMITFKRVKRK